CARGCSWTWPGATPTWAKCAPTRAPPPSCGRRANGRSTWVPPTPTCGQAAWWRACAGASSSGAACGLRLGGLQRRALQGVTLQAFGILLQCTDAAGLGLAAPLLQALQRGLRILAACFQHLGQARAVLDQGVDARTLRDPGLQLLAGLRLEPATVVGQPLAQLARQQRAQARAGRGRFLTQ